MNNKDFKREYPTLYGINIGFQVLGWLLLICSVVLIIIGTSNINRYDMTDFYIFIASAIGTSILAILVFALVELIKILVRIEFNTRKDTHNKETSIYFKSEDGNKNQLTYEEWQKDNPSKSINDYYAKLKK